ncbi:hypothetical protein [Paenibacillus kandeliae]|uniref:hypothetical protein n=1 Tax=Paenibacillus kandeliae TaxID=3231269 RepID=UPI003459E7BA
MTNINEKNLEKEADRREKALLAQLKAGPQTFIMIPDDPANPDDKVVPIGINGLFYTVPRGQMVEVPVPVAEIWNDSYMRTRIANQKIDESTKTEIKVV